jgi:hypothetical protein
MCLVRDCYVSFYSVNKKLYIFVNGIFLSKLFIFIAMEIALLSALFYILHPVFINSFLNVLSS